MEGGVYLESHLSDDGLPLEYFLVDPPLKTKEVEAFKHLPSIGQTTFERNGTTHIIDVVGKSHYPNVADFIEETKRYGLSRRIRKNFDFSLLSPSSQIFLVHDKAYIENYYDYPKAWTCPKAIFTHSIHDLDKQRDSTCLGLVWIDLEPSTIIWNKEDDSKLDIVGSRFMPDSEKNFIKKQWHYLGRPRPKSVEPIHHQAIFMRLPIHNICVVGKSEKANKNYDNITSLDLSINVNRSEK